MMHSLPPVPSCGRGCSPSTSGRGLPVQTSRGVCPSHRSQHLRCAAGKDDNGGGFFGGLANMLGGGKRGGDSSSSSRAGTVTAPPPASNTPSSQNQRTAQSAQQQESSAAGSQPPSRVKTVPEERSTMDSILTAPSTANPEFPPYSVVQKGPVYNLRLYDVYPIVEMAYTNRGDGYASLGSYFDGQNSEGVKFAYTQPVVMRYEPGGRKSMAMFVGSRRGVSKASPASNGSQSATATTAATASISSLPTPDDPLVRLAVAGGELVAVHVFEGNITPETAAAARARLIAELQQDGISLAEEEQAGYFRVGQYGAVYQLGGRLNELQLRVKP